MTTDSATRTPTASGLTPRRADIWAGVAGVVAALVTLAIAEVGSLLLGGIGNPILAVGSLIIDLVPAGFKTLVIELFDTADKLVLFICLGLVVLVFAVVAGILEVRRAPWGVVLLSVVAAVALIAVVTRAGASLLDAVPTVAGVIAGALLLRALASRLEAWRAAPRREGSALYGPAPRYERRSFLRLAIVAGVAGAVVGAGARVMGAAAAAVSEVRSTLGLPAPAVEAPPIPPGATLEVPGITPFITPNSAFYRIDTALQVPSVDPREWRLRVIGMVEEEVEIDFDELLALPLEQHLITLACVSNPVGGDLIGNAVWLGYPIRKLLERARPMPGADMVLSRSVDGFTASTPIEVLQDEQTDALLAVGMNGEPLPLDNGFPVRMVVPGLYGYVSATKWVVELKVTRFADDIAYWTPRGWTARGPIKLSSRIDTPDGRRSVPSGRVVVGGMAWAQHIGIELVQVSVDGGPWRDATLARTVTVDTWVQWAFEWDASAGDHEITVRAIDSNGLVQTADIAPVAPDGATGLHSVTVSVT